jgi:hypothetical protein
MDFPIFDRVDVAHPVFDAHQWFLVAVIQFVQDKAETFSIDWPAPRRFFQIRIRLSLLAAACRGDVGVSVVYRCAVVTERKVVGRVISQYFFVAILHLTKLKEESVNAKGIPDQAQYRLGRGFLWFLTFFVHFSERARFITPPKPSHLQCIPYTKYFS